MTWIELEKFLREQYQKIDADFEDHVQSYSDLRKNTLRTRAGYYSRYQTLMRDLLDYEHSQSKEKFFRDLKKRYNIHKLLDSPAFLANLAQTVHMSPADFKRLLESD